MGEKYDPISDSERFDLLRAKGMSEEITRKISTAYTKWIEKHAYGGACDDILEDIHDDLTKLLNAVRDIMDGVPYAQGMYPIPVKPDDRKKFAAGIKVLEKNGVYKITLPLLVPRKFYQTTDNYKQFYKARYINSLIWYALDDYFNTHSLEPIEDAAILFVHIHEKCKAEWNRYVDNDNVEAKHCIDRIANYLIATDQPTRCEVHHIAQYGSKSHTDIYVMPQKTAREHLYDVAGWNFLKGDGE